jgi:glycosyltransferase involved in cell wall biosynthesis
MKKSDSKRILLLTYAFSPLQAPEAFLAAKSLSKINAYTIDVLTLDYLNLGLAQDHSLHDYILENFGKIFRVKSPIWINQKIFNFLRYFSYFPDKYSHFNKYIFKKAIEINVEKYGAIISWSQSHSIHLAALKIKKRFPTLPWIAHLSDPWADNPFFFKYVGYRTIQKPLEKKVIKNADAINFTTNLTRMMVMKKYPNKLINKTYVTPHSYDLSLYKSKKTDNSNNIKITYFGNFYGPRNPLKFLKALEQLNKNNSHLFKNILFEFIGKWIGNEDWKLNNLNLPKGLINIEKPISYTESLQRMQDSDMLLILDAPFKTSIFFPSKLVDYIGAKKPILAFTPEGSCAEIVREIGGFVYYPESVSSIKEGVIKAISFLRSNSSKKNIQFIKKNFSNDFVSKQFQLLIDQVVI